MPWRRHSFIMKPTVPRFIPKTGTGGRRRSSRPCSVWSMKPSPPSAMMTSASAGSTQSAASASSAAAARAGAVGEATSARR
ncbi:hypothetical protein WR25_25631 [Diploscapter pachys]|uniref:Uncharacterized protein n=1 Tax=Diploscapter pachys TaxID=2018661 RepID=A0A2A2M4N8_9BILA|nr:hypothetical protein WR25_25631 [Diploscapter pachys]